MKINGIEVFDAVRPVVLHIRRHDTVKGLPRSPEGCAAALSACRLPGVIEARVYRARTYLLRQDANGRKHWSRHITPGSIRSEIISIDRGGRFEPGDYRIMPPAKSMKLGSIKPTGPKKKNTGAKRVKMLVKGIRRHGPHGGRANA